MKQCKQCLEVLSLDSFYKNSASSSGKMNICKKCSLIKSKAYHLLNTDKRKQYRLDVKEHANSVRILHLDVLKTNQVEYDAYILKERNRYLKYTYGIDQNHYDGLRKLQNYKCAICNDHETVVHKACAMSSSTALYVDHCHTTQQIRGLLCMLCNSLIGKAKDSPVILQNAIDYLSK